MDKSEITFDEIAEKIFYPIYEEIANSVINKTKIKSGKLLDIGCGGGHVGFAVLEKGNFDSCTFADINPKSQELVTKRGEGRGLSEKISFVVADVHQLPFGDNQFDLVVSRGSIPFWDDQIKAFSEIYRVLAVNGCAYVGCGLGNSKLQKEIKDKMKERGLLNNMKKVKENSKALSNDEYEKFFKEIGCEYSIIDDDENGRWFVFKKLK
ncbi:MAG: class I SAM-dependent methyltransferase [Oscillospiraceae bacterium]